MLLSADFRRWRASVVQVKGGSEEGEGKSADSEREMRTAIAEDHPGPTAERASA